MIINENSYRLISFSRLQVSIKAVHLRPDPKHPAQECQLKVSILPLRLNIDQDALFFLYRFFTDIADDKSGPSTNGILFLSR